MNDFPKRDTVRSKKKLKRKIYRTIRHINKGLRNDVFKDRFWVEVTGSRIVPWDDSSGWNAHFLISFHDRENPNRDYSSWFDPHFIIYSGFFAGGDHVDTDLNEFIIRSDFWEKYKTKRGKK